MSPTSTSSTSSRMLIMMGKFDILLVACLIALSGSLGGSTLVSAFTTPKVRQTSTSSIQIRQLRPQLRAGGDDFSELTSTLARLDQQWAIQQQSNRNRKSRWSKLILPKDPDQEATEEAPTLTSTENNNPEDFVWVLEPPSNSIPSCVIVFTGGAGLGQFPHIAYNELLSRVSDRLNAVCIAAPYQVGLDHFALAKQTGERLRRALVYCEDDPMRQYPPTIPIYSLGHSLGCKLQTIYSGATGQTFDGVGFMSFNNFSFAKTIGMARMFADQIRKNTAGSSPSSTMNFFDNDELLEGLFSFAETMVGAIGIDFSPNAQDTERLIQLRYDEELQKITRLFVFDEDNLDNSKEFMDCCGSAGVTASGLPGGHLAPVFFKLGFDDLDIGDVPPDAREMAREAIGGFQSASFGDEEALNQLVDEVCNWILGKPPSRAPLWGAEARNEPPKLPGVSSAKS